MARSYQFSGGLGGKRANGQRWYSSGGLGTRTNIGGPDEDYGVRVPEHHLGEVRQPRQRAASEADTRMNSSPSTTRPGTQSPSQPQRALPGVRMFGRDYTWSSAQERKDNDDPNFNRSVGGNVLKQAVVAGKPAAVAAPEGDRSDPMYAEEDDYVSAASEYNAVGAGNAALGKTASRAQAMLDRTGKPFQLGPYNSTPGNGRLGVVMTGRGVGALFGGGELKSTTTDQYYVPAAGGREVNGGVELDITGAGGGSTGVSLLYNTGGKQIGAAAKGAIPTGTFAFGKTGITYKPPEGFNELGKNTAMSRPPAPLGTSATLASPPKWDGTPAGVDAAFPDVDMSSYQAATRQERSDNERLFNAGISDRMKTLRPRVPGANYARYTNAR